MIVNPPSGWHTGLIPRLEDETFITDLRKREDAGPFICTVGAGSVHLRISLLTRVRAARRSPRVQPPGAVCIPRLLRVWDRLPISCYHTFAGPLGDHRISSWALACTAHLGVYGVLGTVDATLQSHIPIQPSCPARPPPPPHPPPQKKKKAPPRRRAGPGPGASHHQHPATVHTACKQGGSVGGGREQQQRGGMEGGAAAGRGRGGEGGREGGRARVKHKYCTGHLAPSLHMQLPITRTGSRFIPFHALT